MTPGEIDIEIEARAAAVLARIEADRDALADDPAGRDAAEAVAAALRRAIAGANERGNDDSDDR